jgi:hypothetical protein
MPFCGEENGMSPINRRRVYSYFAKEIFDFSLSSSVDKPIAAPSLDLNERGSLKGTMVLWIAEFGCIPFSQAT